MGTAYHLDCPHCGGGIDLIPEPGAEVARPKEKTLYTLNGRPLHTQNTSQCPGCKQTVSVEIGHRENGFSITYHCPTCKS